ncbi:hypothetical protein [Nonomuraea turcica]|uniref:hypothetical protein n=1 Tax=Nonomuraea sp. G32 TaxID=3067274 RepID=UPI00273C8D5D|nr:hypothetical protein [Nonomuraea sp. G32]MDP4509964.1 hypothetical protein [Nonomuraea sp. G32]
MTGLATSGGGAVRGSAPARGPAQALRDAVLDLRELYGAAEPDLWAPYVLVGLPD